MQPTSAIQRLNDSTVQYGLIGYPLTHSFSPVYFREKFSREKIDAVYSAFPLEKLEELPALLHANPQLRGLNVTTPYKQSAMPFLHEISEDAKAIGAVNCIAIRKGGLYGYNTDWTAFRDSLMPLLQPQHISALVLGAGGAALAIRFALTQMNIPFKAVSRSAGKADLTYAALSADIVAAHPLIINTTTLGTLGSGMPALPYDALTRKHLLYDLVYNPPRTPFLERGLAAAATIKNGLEMLQLQAEASWHIWSQQTEL